MFMGLLAEIRGRKKILSFVLLLQTISKWPNLPFICHLYLLHLVSLVSDLDSLGFCYIQPPIMQSSLTNLMVYKPRPWGIPGCQIPFQMCFLLKRTILEDIKGKHSPVTSKCKKKKKVHKSPVPQRAPPDHVSSPPHCLYCGGSLCPHTHEKVIMVGCALL